MGKYSKETNSALQAIKEAGVIVTHLASRGSAMEYDPVSGEYDKTQTSKELFSVVLPATLGKFKNMDVRFADGTLSIEKAKLFLCSGLYNNGTGVPSFLPGDTLKVGQEEWSVICCQPLDPDASGVPVINKVAAIKA